MEQQEILTQKESKFHKIAKRIHSFWNAIWENKWYPLLVMGILFTLVQFFVWLYPFSWGGFMNINSDDLLQYYPYVGAFFDKIKTGTFSLYDTDLYGGVSFFSAVYYIPLDLFTFLAFLLSFIMPGESAYALTNFMRPALGGMLLYYVLARKMDTKVAFVSGLILFVGGTTEAYYIFPVYLGICFYAPLAMLLIDLCIDYKGITYLVLPLYSITVIFYDFYIAYMLLAFASIYFVVAMHINNEFSFFGKNCILWNKSFWIRFLEFFFFILLGVCIAGCMLVPAALYITKESSRNSSETISSIIYQFLKPNEEKESMRFYSMYSDGKYILSKSHYLTQWVNLFIPNEPHEFCLNPSGAYLKEHASLYITSGALLYLVYFFFLPGKKANRLKGWLVFLNVLLCIPLFAILFCFNLTPYIRWFFIPYFFNLYAAAYAMNYKQFRIGERSFIKFIPMILMILGLITLIYVLVANPEWYLHYSKGDLFFLPILIPAIVFISLYILILLSCFFVEIFTKRKNLHAKLLPIFICLECVFAGVIIFTNTDNYNTYYQQKTQSLEFKNTLTEQFDVKKEEGYRINMYTSYARSMTNSNILIGQTNFGTFFQSFYNTPMDTIVGNVYNTSTWSWSRRFNSGYTLLQAPLFNVKYVVSNEGISLPEKYYDFKTDDAGTKYYALKDAMPFLVYEEGFTHPSSLDYFNSQAAVLYYAYIEEDFDNEEVQANLDFIKDKGFPILSEGDVALTIKDYVVQKNLTKDDTWGDYFVYYLDSIESSFYRDGLMVYANNRDVRSQTDGFIYFANYDKNNEDNQGFEKCDQFHYNMYYLKDTKAEGYNSIFVQHPSDVESTAIVLYSYDYALYDNFVEKQSTYTNKEFTLDGRNMHIACDLPKDGKPRIIKTAYTYSKEWELEQMGYSLVNVGGFLGILTDGSMDKVDITLHFNPYGYSTGLKLSFVGSIIYLSILTPVIILTVRKIKKKNEEKE